MQAAKQGYIAEFKTGYLQIEIRKEFKVKNGTDNGLRDLLIKGIAVGRLAKEDGEYLVPANGLDDAKYIVAQSDDTIRDLPQDYNYPERYTTLPNLIVKNSEEIKTVAVYQIVNKDDVKLIKIAEPVTIAQSTGYESEQFINTGVNTFKVVGFAPYVAEPTVSGNPAGNYIRFKLVNAEINTADKFNAANTVEGTTIVYKRHSGLADDNTENKTTIATEIGTNGGIEIEACINNTNTLTIEVMWRTNEWSKYTFDLTDLTRGTNA